MSGLTSMNGYDTSVSGGTSVTLVHNRAGVLHRVIYGGTFVGTIAFYDSSTVGGTAAGNQIFSFGDPTTTFPQVLQLGIHFKDGLVYTATGTPLVTIVSS